MAEISTDVIIIGGGASGLMAAYGAATAFTSAGIPGKVIVLEKMPRPGRKIMITGKGRCNFTNLKQWNEFSSHLHPKPNIIKPAFHNLTPVGLTDWMKKHGLETLVERGDRAFPVSHLASDVVDTIVRAAVQAGAGIHCSKEVTEIVSGDIFTIRCADGSSYNCSRVVLCTGGLSYPNTGSTGDGYVWAEKMGHSIRPLFPSLTAIVPKGYKDGGQKGHLHRSLPLSGQGRLLCGNHLKNVRLSVMIDGNEVQNEFGDLDFTDGGIEGPIGFKVSRKCVHGMTNGARVSVSIDLKPAVSIDELEVRIGKLMDEISKDRNTSQKPYRERFRMLLTKILPQSLIPAFAMQHPGIDCGSLPKALKDWKMDIAGYVGYERCVITAGGVNTDEINMKTLESKRTSGVYFAGEVMDVDADTGGYNLHVAFSTGLLAGISAARSLL